MAQVMSRLAKQLFSKLIQRSESMALALQARGFEDVESHQLVPVVRPHSPIIAFASYASLLAACFACFKVSTV